MTSNETKEWAEAFDAGWKSGRKALMKHLCTIPLNKALHELEDFAKSLDKS